MKADTNFTIHYPAPQQDLALCAVETAAKNNLKPFDINKVKSDLNILKCGLKASTIKVKCLRLLSSKRRKSHYSTVGSTSLQSSNVTYYYKDNSKSVHVPSESYLEYILIERIEEVIKDKVGPSVSFTSRKYNKGEKPTLSSFINQELESLRIINILGEGLNKLLFSSEANYDFIEKVIMDRLIEKFLNTKSGKMNIISNHEISSNLEVYLSENLKRLRGDEKLKQRLKQYFDDESLEPKSDEISRYFEMLVAIRRFRRNTYKSLKLEFYLHNCLEEVLINQISSNENNNDIYKKFVKEVEECNKCFQKSMKSKYCSDSDNHTHPEVDASSHKVESNEPHVVLENLKLEIGSIELIKNECELMSTLNLSHSNIEGEYFRFIFSGIKFCPSIIELNISHNSLSSEGCYELGKLLYASTSLKVLDISFCSISDQSLNSLVLGLKCPKLLKLEKLNINNNIITGLVISSKNLAFILSKALQLKSLNISYNDLLDGFSHFLNIIANSNDEEFPVCIEKLIAIKIGLKEKTAVHLANLLVRASKQNYFSKLNSLILSSNYLNFSQFFTILKGNTSLKELILGKCSLNDSMKSSIVSLILNSKIETLNFFSNNFTSKDTFLSIILASAKATDLKSLLKLKQHPLYENDGFSTTLSDKETDSKMLPSSFNVVNNCFLELENPEKHTRKMSEFTPLSPFPEPQPAIEVKLQSLDLSKNPCEELLCTELIVILQKIELKSLDLSGVFKLKDEDKGLELRLRTLIKNRKNIYI